MTGPLAAMEVEEENFGVNFKRLSPEIREMVLSHSSLSTWSALSQTSKAWYETNKPFLSIHTHHIDFARHFSEQTTFKLEYSKSSFWILAREYREETDNVGSSTLSVLKINTLDLKETLINLNLKLGWSRRSANCSGSANPVCFCPCPHGGIFVYAPIDARRDILFVNDSGAIDLQPILKNYNHSRYIDIICGEKYIALNSKYGKPAPILFVPYSIDDNNTINYISESDAYEWPRFQKIADRGHSMRSLGIKFLLEINNGVDEYTGFPFLERSLIINPAKPEDMLTEHESNNYPLSADPIVEILIKNTIFPEHYKLLNRVYVKENNFLFLLGRLSKPWESGEDVYGINEGYRDLNYRKESPYPYGVIVIKNLKNFETIGKKFLFDNTQLSDIQNETMKITDSYLFITTTFRKRSTPKLTAIGIKDIQRLLSTRHTTGL
ncbi:MAG: hypothetical protein H0X26_08900 [Alphaproteobacteria bacterium]|nr:hypothetical protein [Alphaproteobacteria bacterium]